MSGALVSTWCVVCHGHSSWWHQKTPHQNTVVPKENYDCGSLSLSKAEAPKPVKSCEWDISHEPLVCSYCYQAEQNRSVYCRLFTPQTFPYNQASLDRIKLIKSPQTFHRCLKTLFIKTLLVWRPQKHRRNMSCQGLPIRGRQKSVTGRSAPGFHSLLLKCYSWFDYSLQQIESIRLLAWSPRNQWQNNYWDSQGWFSITPYKVINRCKFSQLPHIC